MPYRFNIESPINGANFDFYDLVLCNRMHKSKVVPKIGVNNNVGTAPVTLWTGTGIQQFFTAQETLNLVSTSANDTLAGTGAQTVLLLGLNDQYEEIQEIVNMNGLTPVVTTTQFFRINEVVVFTAGTGGVNAGAINVTGSGTGTQIGFIGAGFNRGQSFNYTVPYNKHLIIKWAVLSSSKNSNVVFTVFEQYPNRAKIPIFQSSLITSSQELNIKLGGFFPPKTEVTCEVNTTSGTGAAGLTWTGYLIPTEYFDSNAVPE